MSDNLEQLEKDWPTRPPRNSQSSLANMPFLAFAIVITVFTAVLAVISALNAWRHHVVLWQLHAFDLSIAVAMPWLAARAAFTNIKRAIVVSSTPLQILQAVQSYGEFALFLTCLAVMLVLENSSFH